MDNFACLQAFSEEQKKFLQMDNDNLRRCLQAQTEENGDAKTLQAKYFKQELPCLIENLKIRSLIHDDDHQPNKSLQTRDFRAHYKTQPSHEPQRESNYFAINK